MTPPLFTLNLPISQHMCISRKFFYEQLPLLGIIYRKYKTHKGVTLIIGLLPLFIWQYKLDMTLNTWQFTLADTLVYPLIQLYTQFSVKCNTYSVVLMNPSCAPDFIWNQTTNTSNIHTTVLLSGSTSRYQKVKPYEKFIHTYCDAHHDLNTMVRQ